MFCYDSGGQNSQQRYDSIEKIDEESRPLRDDRSRVAGTVDRL
jgi:hypothetical protein